MPSREIKLPGPNHPITIEPAPGRIVVRAAGRVIADTTRALLLREASYPPVAYIPREDADMTRLAPSETTSWCPYKGEASYFSLIDGERIGIADILWTYEHPHEAVAAIAGHFAFYPDRVEAIETALT